MSSLPQSLPGIAAAASELLARRSARINYLDFMKYCWWNPQPFCIGRHTLAIANRLTKAVDDYLEFKSTYLLIQVPFRHGKSDLVSRGFPPFFLGRCAEVEPDVIMTAYGAKLAETFSDKARRIIKSRQYQRIFPSIRLSKEKHSSAKWRIEGSAGEVNVAGLLGGLNGQGGGCVILDDYCKNREEAESVTYREKAWEAFKDDLMTRRSAKRSIVVICATPWHVDDVAGRILKAMENDRDFPRFELLRFPARSKDYPDGYLFAEQMTMQWYKEQYATLGQYSAAGLLDACPVLRGGAMFKTDNVVIHEDDKDFPQCRYVRSWDLASTEKQTSKDDPDYTVGALVGRTRTGILPDFWIKDVCKGQWGATERNKMILACAIKDGIGVKTCIESVGGYKDTFDIISKALFHTRSVQVVNVSTDKVVRNSIMEPLFEGGVMHFTKAAWEKCHDEFEAFPNGKHDDTVDSIGTGITILENECENKTAPRDLIDTWAGAAG